MNVSKFPTLPATIALTLACVLLEACGGGGRSSPQDTGGECSSNEECTDAALSICSDSVCVECVANADCDCNSVCSDNNCVPLGIRADLLGLDNDDPLPPAERAHGVWEGTPDTENYRLVDSEAPFCETDADCNFGQICSSLTRSCFFSADYQTACTDAESPCPDGLACDPRHNVCLPGAACVDQRNCCGLEGITCQQTSTGGQCLGTSTECTPPDTIENECPFSPREAGGCSGTDFCNASGKCVQCACDDDCDPATGQGICNFTTGRCAGCVENTDCDTGEVCDSGSGFCTTQCTEGSCPTGELCETETGVCRPIVQPPCAPDAFAGNDTLEDAQTNSITLAIPATGESSTFEDLSLCTSEPADWFGVALEAGDRLQVTGSTTTILEANMRAFAPDGSTRLDTGQISDQGNELLDFTANFAGTFWIEVERRQNRSGSYQLSLSLLQGQICEDPFEDANGRDDSVETALLLNDDTAAPSGCTVTGAQGSDQTIGCTGNALRICTGDADFYRIEAPAGASVLVEVTGNSGDLDAKLYGPFIGDEVPNTERQADSSGSAGINETLEDHTRTGGTYIIHVYRFSGTDPSYSLSVAIEAGETCVEDIYDQPTSSSAFDPDGFNDRVSQASGVPLMPDGSGEATLTLTSLKLCSLDIDFFKIGIDDLAGALDPIPENMEFLITLENVVPTSGVEMFGGLDPDSVESSATSSSSSGALSLVGRPTEEGIYYIAIRPEESDSGNFDYDVKIQLLNPPSCSPDTANDQPSGATVLDGSGGWPEGIADPAGTQENIPLCIDDINFYRAALEPGEQLVASIFYDRTASSLAMRGFDSSVAAETVVDGVVPETGAVDNSEMADTGFQWVEVDLDGDGYFAVFNKGNWVGDYDMVVDIIEEGCVEDVYDAGDGNNIWQDATPLVLQTNPLNTRQQTAFISNLRVCSTANGERDYYAVDLGEGDEISATFYNNANDGSLDFFLRRPGPDGVNTSVDSALGSISGERDINELSYTVPAGGANGDYLIEVRPYDPSGNNDHENLYFMDVSVTRACAEDAFEPSSQATPFSLGPVGDWNTIVPFDEDLALCRDEDWYALNVPATTQVTVCLDFLHNDGDIDLFVYDSLTPVDGDGLPSGVAGASQTNTTPEKVTFTSTAAATYYVRAAFDTIQTQTNQTYAMKIVEGSSCP